MSDVEAELRMLGEKAQAFKQEAHRILARHEAATSRIILLSESYKKLSGLTLQQDELFRQALRCVEHSLFRSAHVMAWAGFADWLQNELMRKWLARLKQVRPNWKVQTVEQLKEQFPEYQHIEACAEVGMCGKTVGKALQGLLNKRNECAHPSSYSPDLNETLGYVSELFKRIEILRTKFP